MHHREMHQIIRQPDGRYLLWGTQSEATILRDLTAWQVVLLIREREGVASAETEALLARIDAGERVYGDATVSYHKAIRHKANV